VIISSVYEGSFFWNQTTCTQLGSKNQTVTENVQFNLSSSSTMRYGYQTTDDDTFDVVYSLMIIRTALQGQQPQPQPQHQSSFALEAAGVSASAHARKLLISSVGCIYVVSAAGAAQPDIRANVYNGAMCMWSRVDGVGENFLVDYALPL
jgi:hypothetical protein